MNVILQDGHMPLHAASYYGHVDIVHMLLHANADPNAINRVNVMSTVICSKQENFSRFIFAHMLLILNSCQICSKLK